MHSVEINYNKKKVPTPLTVGQHVWEGSALSWLRGEGKSGGILASPTAAGTEKF